MSKNRGVADKDGLGLLSWIDQQKADFGFYEFLGCGFKSVLFGILITIKSYFGPLTVAFVLSSFVYAYVEYNQIDYIPILKEALMWLFSYAPKWVEASYFIAIGIYALLSSGYDSIK